MTKRSDARPDSALEAVSASPGDEHPLSIVDGSPGADGLTGEEAGRRLEKYGPNELVESSTNPALKFLTYFWGPIPWMIEVAIVLSAVVRHWSDLAIIGTLLVANAVVGFWEEYQAGNAIAALKAHLALRAHVKRDGKWLTIPARDLVPGDLVRLRLGNIVPADTRLVDGDSIVVDQSALTGESLPVTREGGENVYSGSIIKQGETDGLVYATGAMTYFGKTAALVQSTRTTSHFQRAVLNIGHYLIAIAVALVAVILVASVIRGDSFTTTLQFALVLTIAAIPVAMPTVLSVTMAVGSKLLAGKKAIVSRLASIEELAGVDVLCSDKTGTLTKNELTLGDPYVVSDTTADEVVRMAALASREEDEDSIDRAVLAGVENRDELARYRIERFRPFDPVNKRTEALVVGPDGEELRVSKGAPQVILDLVGDSGDVRSGAEAASDDFARRGFRSLGVAERRGTGQWRFLGLLPLYDPPREDSKPTLDTAREMGLRVKMLTGDQVAIGKETARQLGMGSDIRDAGILEGEDGKNDERVADLVEEIDGVAQVYPEHKYRIVELLQRRGHITAMTGDGVNDSPALKKADAGIAVAGATDAARSAADIVLLTPGLSVIVDAIKESRRIFQRMTSYATYRIAETIRVLLFMTLSILAFNFYPVTAVMIVLLALLNDGAILSIAYDRAHYSRAPDRWNMRDVLVLSTALGVAGVVASFGLFYLGERVFHLDRSVIQSLIYLKLSVAGHLTIFVTRTRRPFWSDRPAGILLGAVLGTQALATLIAVYGVFMTPIGWGWALLVWGYAALWFLFNDRVKLATLHFLNRGRAESPTPEAPGGALA
jgi:H+-transporting ATPase